LSKLQEFKESFIEILVITKVCLTTFWFWLPALFAAYIYFQLWIVFFVHPLTILIMPVVLAVFAMIWEEKSVKDQYGLVRAKLLSASDPLGANPEWKKVRWDVEKAIKEYKETLRNAEEKKEEKS
jgi:hypothetical protein